MADRLEIERLLRELYAARLRGDIEALCRLFSDDARFEIAGASQSNPIAATCAGIAEFRPLLALLIKSFKLSGHAILSLIIDGDKAAVHWRTNIYSRITGKTVPTALVDLVEMEHSGRIVSYTEFFVPARV